MVAAGRRERQTTREAGETGDGREEARELARERLRRAVAGGDYDGLLDPALWRLLDTAAEPTGFGREIGALRFAMARLLAEEEDPRHLATHLARVATTIVRVTQAQHRSAAPDDDPVRSALLAALGELDGPAGGDGREGAEGGEDGW